MGTAPDQLCPTGADDSLGAKCHRTETILARGVEMDCIQNEFPHKINIRCVTIPC